MKTVTDLFEEGQGFRKNFKNVWDIRAKEYDKRISQANRPPAIFFGLVVFAMWMRSAYNASPKQLAENGGIIFQFFVAVLFSAGLAFCVYKTMVARRGIAGWNNETKECLLNDVSINEKSELVKWATALDEAYRQLPEKKITDEQDKILNFKTFVLETLA
jgi:hypothetical protein